MSPSRDESFLLRGAGDTLHPDVAQEGWRTKGGASRISWLLPRGCSGARASELAPRGIPAGLCHPGPRGAARTAALALGWFPAFRKQQKGVPAEAQGCVAGERQRSRELPRGLVSFVGDSPSTRVHLPRLRSEAPALCDTQARVPRVPAMLQGRGVQSGGPWGCVWRGPRCPLPAPRCGAEVSGAARGVSASPSAGRLVLVTSEHR